MNARVKFVPVTLSMLGCAFTLHAEFVSVVEVTDLRGNKHIEVCTDAEKKKIEGEIRAEGKVFTKALEETKTEWKTVNKDTPFPASLIKARTMRVLTTTANREEADKFLSKTESHVNRAIDGNKQEEERILKMKPSSSRKGGNGAQVKRMQDDVKKDRERASNADRAEDSLRKKLSVAAGHEVPFYGESAAPAPKEAPKKK